MTPPGQPSRPVDGNHALLIGNLLGLLLRDKDTILPDLVTEVDPVMLGSDYSNQIRLTRTAATDSATYIITVEQVDA